LIIQECEHPDKLVFSSTTQRPNDFLWFGENKHKGLGVFSYSDCKFQLLDQHNADIKIISPILSFCESVQLTVSSNNFSFSMPSPK
jgi:hypothetical protein